jgi:hypothetical protein
MSRIVRSANHPRNSPKSASAIRVGYTNHPAHSAQVLELLAPGNSGRSLTWKTGTWKTGQTESVSGISLHQDRLTSICSSCEGIIRSSTQNYFGYCNFLYSALASFRTAMSGSASFQRIRKSL